MKRTLLGWTAVVAGVAAALAALLIWSFSDRREWTTESKPALEAYREGLEARMRLYVPDAIERFRRAVELDPGFAAARVQLVELSNDLQERRAMAEALRGVDPETLTRRERFLVELALARAERDGERVAAIAERFAAALPEDPWALFVVATRAWEAQEWERAEQLFQRLLQADPNWVIARNHLGYLAMAQGRFADAEEHFRTYEYVAPDQANPHDSLGELLVLTGRYEEAREELEAGLAVRPDFCASYRNLMGIALFESRVDEMERVLDRIEAHCPGKEAEMARCEARLTAAFFDRDWERPWRENLDLCLSAPHDRGPLFHRVALLAGRDDVAAAEEKAWRELAAKSTRYVGKMGGPQALVLHLEGVRALAEGRPEEAAEKLAAADQRMLYWGLGDGRLKLFTQMNLAVALERSGDSAGARQVLERVRAVNPRWEDFYAGLDERTPGGAAPRG